MMIMHVDGKGFTNSRNCTRITLNGVFILAHMVDESTHHLGVFETENEAKIAFENLFKQLEHD